LLLLGVLAGLLLAALAAEEPAPPPKKTLPAQKGATASGTPRSERG